MLTALKNNRSLFFYQQTALQKPGITSAYTGGIASVAVANTSYVTISTTNAYNIQLNNYITTLHSERDRLTQRVAHGQAADPNYQGARNDGVKSAWNYEKADVDIGGNGSANWNKAQRSEIKQTGKVRGAEGHHQQNVSDHPDQQANPDNIKFYKSKKAHLRDGHGGNWDNESNEPTIDKDKMLKNTNSKRVFKNELRGLGTAVAIGLGIGITIGFITTLAQTGIAPDSVRYAAIEGAKSGIEAGTMSAIGYGVGRTIGEIASKAATGLVESLGVTLTENLSKMINMGVVGTLTIVVFSAYQFAKLKRQGIDTRNAFLQTGKQALFSLSLLAVAIAAQGIWGGCAGIIVSVSIGIIIITYSVATSIYQRHFAEKVQIYMIDKCYPVFGI